MRDEADVRQTAGELEGTEDDTARLVERARQGDADAFARLVTLQYRFIYRTAFRWLGNRSDAEDVTQTVCLRLANALAGFDRRAAFTSWLYRVTLNAVRDLQRSQQRRERQIGALALVTEASAEPDQEQQLRVADIWRIVRQLPEKQRDAVLLVHSEGMSHQEAARVMGCREATVSWHIHKARKALRGLL